MSLKRKLKNFANNTYEPLKTKLKKYYRPKQYVKKWGKEEGLRLYNDFFNYTSEEEETHFQLSGYPHTLFLRKATSDEPTFRQVFMNIRYDMNLDFSPETILDGGANVGYASVFFANKYPEAQILAIEPNSSNYDQVIKNTRSYSTIKPQKTAIWGRSTCLKIINPDTDHWAFEVAECDSNDEGAFEAVSINQLIEQEGWDSIDILKLDIEGAEMNVFKDKSHEDWLPKVKLLIIELHERIQPGCTEIFENAIAKYNFEKSISGENLVYMNKN
ncbi:FkbM family methyltransferase [Roseivirga sp.]|uniref:FkbM family methyltransferase n=1 Tax=Roseivirga sp. TaxID=1964215 RepID=UPI003B529332